MKRFFVPIARPRSRGLQPLDVAVYAAAVAVSYGVKRHSSTAAADELAYLLQPTAALVEYATGYEFIAERGTGFFCRELHLVIAPVCSGANFLIVSFAALVFGFSNRAPRPSSKLTWFVASAALAYVSTLVINAARITLSLRWAEAPAASPSGEAAHRLIGIVAYLGGLLLLYAFAGQLFDRRKLSAFHFALPLAVYSGVTLVVPWLRGAASRPDYWEHAGAVSTVVAAAAALLLVQTARRSLFGRDGEGFDSGRRGDGSVGARSLVGRGNQTIEELEQRPLDLGPAGCRDGRTVRVANVDHVVQAVGPSLHVDSQDVYADRRQSDHQGAHQANVLGNTQLHQGKRVANAASKLCRNFRREGHHSGEVVHDPCHP